jgi:pyridoxine 4-dehydrogenase
MSLPSVTRVGYGAMNLTWKPQQTPDEQAFKAILQAIESANGQRVLLNSGEFYGFPEPTLNLSLLSRFYKAHPEAIEQTFLSVKGGIKLVNKQMAGPDGSLEGLRASVTNM